MRPAGAVTRTSATLMRLEHVRKRAARISLTPLIDVVFILLLFFMLTTRFGQQQAMAIDLPGTGGEIEPLSDVVVLNLSTDGSIRIAGQRVESTALPTHPAMLQLAVDDPLVRIDVNDDATLQTLVRALELFESLGVSDVSVRGLRR